MIQTANATLNNALITAIRDQEGFKNLENPADHKANLDAFDVIPKAQILEFCKHTFQSFLIRFAEMFARRMTLLAVTHTSLNTLPDIESLTLDDYSKIIKDAGDVLLKKELLSPEVLIDHLQAVVLITLIYLTAESKNLKKDYTSKSFELTLPLMSPTIHVRSTWPVSMLTRKTSTPRSLPLTCRRSNLLCPRLALFARWLPLQHLHLTLVLLATVERLKKEPQLALLGPASTATSLATLHRTARLNRRRRLYNLPRRGRPPISLLVTHTARHVRLQMPSLLGLNLSQLFSMTLIRITNKMRKIIFYVSSLSTPLL